MELKSYQKEVIADLARYLELVVELQSPAKAYQAIWNEKNVLVGFGGMPNYVNVLPGVPHVCAKVPTGGGKTYIAASSLRTIFDAMPQRRAKAVVWLVPSEAILTQTRKTLENPDHPYRQRLDVDFGGRVQVYSKEQALMGQNFTPSAVTEQLSLFVLSYDSFRTSKKEGRKAYQENGYLAEFAKWMDDPSVLLADTDETALIQVIRYLNPVVIVDESPHATSDLSVEMLQNFNPSFVFDLTATPKKKSNIISFVDAARLKKANMVKLPVIVYNRKSQADVYGDAIAIRAKLEAQAKREKETSGRYIRPIVLFQAQPRNNADSTTYEKIKKNSVSFSTAINYNILKALKLGATFSYTVSNTDDDVYHGETTNYAKSLAKKNYAKDDFTDNGIGDHFASGSFRKATLLPYGGELKKNGTKNENWMARLQGSYYLFLDEAEKHMLTFMAGLEISSSHYTGLQKTFRCYVPERGLTVGNVDYAQYDAYTKWLTTDKQALGVLKDNLSNKLSYYGSLNYSYQNRYIFNANMRVDYSNAFGDRAREKFLPIWSTSARWNMKEDVLKNVYWVNDLSLKASFGYQGTMHSTQTPELVIIKGELNQAFGEYSSTIKNFPNPDLSWEKTMSINSSIDFSLFNKKLVGSISYFYKKTKDAFLTKKVAQVNGVTSYTVNQGTVENQGLEVALNINPVNTSMGGSRKGFSWRIDPQLGQVVNKLINKVIETQKYDPLHDDYTYLDYLNGTAHVSGKPLNSFYSYEFTGLNSDDGRPMFARTGEEYFEKYCDMPKSKVFTEVMKYTGCRVPYLQGGILNTISWNGFVLSCNISYSIGSKVRLLKLYNPDASSMAVSPTQNLRKEFVKRWQTSGDEKYTNIPGLLSKNEYSATLNPWWKSETYSFAKNIWEMYNYADIRVVSGNYLKLQSLNLRYVFSDNVCKKLHCNSLYMSISGTNLFTWSAKELKGQDPSSQSGSADKINVPITPTYTFSVNVAF